MNDKNIFLESGKILLSSIVMVVAFFLVIGAVMLPPYFIVMYLPIELAAPAIVLDIYLIVLVFTWIDKIIDNRPV
jgi:hypothetical protein